MEGSHMTLCMSKCDKRLNTNRAGKVHNNKSYNALSHDPLGLNLCHPIPRCQLLYHQHL